MSKFKRGDRVTWEAGKRTLTGTIFLVVPPKKDGFIMLQRKDSWATLHNDRFRAHESYIIGPFGKRDDYQHEYYQPPVSKLTKVGEDR